ncbi:MAG: hypothetical protein EBX37_10770, partial [Alphaproteobacteria bacterium]|nr:hypothetical protein [Alphaproteobacteria bacterium]
KDADGRITAVYATLIPDTKSGTPGSSSVKVKGVITWVGATDGVPAEVRLYDRLFNDEQPDAGEVWPCAFAAPLEGAVIDAFGGEGVVAVAFGLVAEGADHLAVAGVAALADINIAAHEFEGGIGADAGHALDGGFDGEEGHDLGEAAE